MKVFIEEQRFKRWILLVVMIVPIVTGMIPIIMAENEIPGFEPNEIWALFATGAVVILVFLLFVFTKLTTKIDELGIHYQYFPRQFSEKLVMWSEIETIALNKNKKFPINKKYGYKKCYIGKKSLSINLGGKHALAIHLKNGKHLLIGTHKHEELERVLANYKHKFE